MDKTEQLLSLLKARQIITAAKVEEIKGTLAKTKEDLGDFLVSQKIINEEKLTELQAELYNLPYYNLTDLEVTKEILSFLPEEIAKTYQIVCFGREDKILKVGLVTPNLKAMEAVNFLAQGQNLQVEYYLISEHSFREISKRYEKMEEEISTALDVKAKNRKEEGLESDKGGGEDDIKAKNFLSSLNRGQIGTAMFNGVAVTNLVVSVHGPDASYKPVGIQDMNPFRNRETMQGTAVEHAQNQQIEGSRKQFRFLRGHD